MIGASPQRLKWFAADVDVRAGSRRATELPLMSVSAYWGVRRRDEITNDPPRAESLDNYKICRNGDIVINKMSAYQGAFGVSPSDGLVSPDYAVLRPSVSVDPRWLVYSMKTPHFMSEISNRLRGIGDVAAGSVRTPRISMTDLLDISWPIPAYEEQRRTADFLDRETAQIDALIAKQEQFIGLLQERLTAEIRRTTVGAAWPDLRLSWLFNCIGSGTTPAADAILDTDEGDHLWVTTSELRERGISRTKGTISHRTLQETSALRVYPAGTLLIAMYGATIGRLAWLDVPAATNQACCAFAEPRGVTPRWAFYCLLAAKPRLLVLASGGGQPNVNQEKLRSLRISVPPPDEQIRLVAYLDSQTVQIDVLIAKATQHISLARERRAALIAEAVTGRIDLASEGAA